MRWHRKPSGSPRRALHTASFMLAIFGAGCSSDDQPLPWFDAPIFSEAFARPELPAPRRPGLSTESAGALLCSGSKSSASAVVVCVSPEGEADGDGTAERPYAAVQQALDAAPDGAIVQVSAGSYRENLTMEARELDLRGGFDAAFSSRLPAEQVTTLSGGARGSVLTISAGSRVRLSGFRLVEGSGNPDSEGQGAFGGGLHVSESDVEIEHCVFEDNDVVGSAGESALEHAGGAVFATDSAFQLRYSVVRANRAGRGAGIAAFGGKQRIVRSEVRDNVSTGDHGGGLYLASSDIVVLASEIRGNRSGEATGYGWGGGILVFDGESRAVLAYNTVSANSAPDSGSGVFIDDGAQAVLANELIYGNSCGSAAGAALYLDGLDLETPSAARVINSTIAEHRCADERPGYAILLEQRSALTLHNTIVWNASSEADPIAQDESSGVRATYTLAPTLLNGSGNLQVDPLFADPASGDFHLRSSGGRYAAGEWTRDREHSEAIDAGDPADDVGAESQPHGERVNLGAFGGTEQASRSP